MSERDNWPAPQDLGAYIARLQAAAERLNGTYVAMVDRMVTEAEACANGEVER